MAASEIIYMYNLWRGKSELHRIQRSVTQSGSDPKESATENIPPGEIHEKTISQGKGEKAGPGFGLM